MRHIHAYSRIIQAYSEPCVIFRTLVYSESWYIQYQRHIQNPGISKTLAHSEPETYSESWANQNPRIFRTGGILRSLSSETSMMECIEIPLMVAIIFTSYNYFRNISFSSPLVHEINMIFFNASHIFTPEAFFHCKKVWELGLRGRGSWILIHLLEVLQWYYALLLTQLRLKMKLHKAVPAVTQEYQHLFILTEISYVLARMLDSLAGCLTELCASDFYWIFF